MRHKNPPYDVYDAKHFARHHGWLPASVEYARAVKIEKIKYFTLCAREAIDVFMFEKEGLLARDSEGQLHNVVICENDKSAVPEIKKLVRPPLQEAVIVGNLEDILTATAGPNADNEDSKSQKERDRRRDWQNFVQLKRFFPFDIVNFDTCNSLMDPPPGENRLLVALDRILELQRPARTFLLFVTTPISGLHNKLEDIFRDCLSQNVKAHEEIRQALLTSKRSDVYDKIEKGSRVVLGFAKSVILPAAQKHGWNTSHKGIYVYDSPTGATRMMSSVVQLSATSGRDKETYVQDIIRIIQHMPEFYSSMNLAQKDEVKNHLARIVQYRDEERGRFALVN